MTSVLPPRLADRLFRIVLLHPRRISFDFKLTVTPAP